MSNVIKPIDYKAVLDMRQTEMGIKLIKEFFQANLSTELRLRRVTAPLFVLLSAYSTLFMPVSPVLSGTVRRRFSIRTSPLGSR